MRREPERVVLTVSRVLLDYPHRLAGHCGSGALRDLMEWAGLGWDGVPSEGLAFGLGGDLGFTYVRGTDLVPPVYLVGRGSDLELDALGRLGAEVEVLSGEDPVEGWAWVKAELDAGRPTLVWADIGDLPYLRVRLRMSRHDIVLVGYDDEERVAFVVDNDRVEVQRVSFEDLARARSSTAFPVPTRHTTYRVRWPAGPPDWEAVAAEALDTAGRRMLDGANGFPIASGTGTTGASGVAGLRLLAQDVPGWQDLLGEQQAELALQSLRVFVEKAGTGGGLFRRLQAAFCREVANRTGCAAAGVAASAYSTCAETWSQLGASAAQGGSIDWRLRRVTDLVRSLDDLEREAARGLLEAAKALGG